MCGVQVWVRQKVVENDMSLFIELPQHLRAEVAWHWNKPILDKVHIFKVCYNQLECLVLIIIVINVCYQAFLDCAASCRVLPSFKKQGLTWSPDRFNA